MSDFEEVQLEIDLKFNEALSYSPYCSTTSGRQFGGGGWDIMPSMDSHRFGTLKFQLNDGKESHEGHKILMNARWASACSEVYRHTITWSKDPTVDTGQRWFHLTGRQLRRHLQGKSDCLEWLSMRFRQILRMICFQTTPPNVGTRTKDGYGDNMAGTNGDAFQTTPINGRMPTVTAMEITTDGGPWVMTVQTNQGRPIGGCTGCSDFDGDGYPEECVEDSCFRGFLTWDENGPGTALLKSTRRLS